MLAPRKLLLPAAIVAAALSGVTLLAVVMIAGIVAALGGDPARALQAMWRGALGSPDALVETLIRATPLALTGLSVAVAFRCGIWNIGAEGQLLIGMLGAALAALLLPPLPGWIAAPLCLLAGAVFGTAWAAVPALLKLKRDVPEVISTIMMNFLAVYLLEYLVRGPMKDPSSASDWSALLPSWARLPRLGALAPGLTAEVARLHVGVLLAVLAVLLLWFWLARSRVGFRITAVGANPAAAGAAGMPVARTVATAFLLSGALAGVAGGVEQLGVISRLFRYLPGEPGYGFSGIAVALLGQLHPLGVGLAALFFGALRAGSDQMQRSAGISFQVAYVIQAAVVLLLVLLPPLRTLPLRHRR
jgi:simple sugar transport system permease protein